MFKKTSIINKALLFFNLLFIIGLLITGFSGYLFNPTHYRLLSIIGLTFPIFLFSNVIFLFLWLIIKKRFAILPFIALALCYNPIRFYSPLNFKNQEKEGECIKILSYNVLHFMQETPRADGKNDIFEYLKNSNADIICIQEAEPYYVDFALLKEEMSKIYPFYDIVNHNGNHLMTFSKFKIIDSNEVEYNTKSNLSMAYTLLIDNDSVLLINNHLESFGLSDKEKNNFKNILKGKFNDEEVEIESKSMIKKLIDSNKLRAEQAITVRNYIKNSGRKSVILCGDFNDHPLSYTLRCIGDDLINCYVETGNGPGFTYQNKGMFVRIDNILCSNNFTPYACTIDKSIKNSDHYPIYCYLKMNKEQ